MPPLYSSWNLQSALLTWGSSLIHFRTTPAVTIVKKCNISSEKVFLCTHYLGYYHQKIVRSCICFLKRNLWNLTVNVLHPPLGNKVDLCYSASEFRRTHRGNNCLSFWRGTSRCSEMYSFSTNLARELEDQ